MKQINLLITGLLLMLATPSFAQITLEKLDGSSRKTLKPGDKIAITLPAPTERPDCDCFHRFEGVLISNSADSAILKLDKDELRYTDGHELARRVVSEYQYGGPIIGTVVPLSGATSILKMHKSDNRRNTGFAMMLISMGYALAIGPFIPPSARKVSDIAAGVTFGIGFGVSLSTYGKVYHLKNQPGKQHPLWRIKK
ncbi:MAG: hypothetical protein NW218_22260 [Saprospiraceae bacterium]|nr:hypothetical protein [Saprospiraceae bacterium]